MSKADAGTTRGPRAPRFLDLPRTLAALAAIIPGLAAGLAAGVSARDRRRGINRAIDVWGDLGTRAAGVQLAVTGREHLVLRPAVFVFNHQSGADPFLLCALLRRDFVGVAKAEIRRNPLLGPAFAFADTVFVDRSDHEHAVRALDPAVATLRRGLAILIAPEGTRSASYAVGPFKKGAFRIALAARAPIVPIVLHDAHNLLPRGGWIMRAGTVHVSVLAPIATNAWSIEALDAHVAAVRKRFVATLAARERS
jgi:putative phosphoserine phosphatase/1-acylglycerol-3-phosphate O-acyltransferase